ncbi:mas-related G-protein coupled receptor member A-like [Macrotis lagotis]|uniref:mas-related G-protein coupled receptor member A-like n=1 Tax=Macrotis lagotis TaxID=92651 RepID=UPI003D68CCEB
MAVSRTVEEQECTPVNELKISENEKLSSGNGTPGNFDLNGWIQIPSLVISVVGLVGNGLVLWLLIRIKRNPFSVYILNLAAADALFLCSTFAIIINKFVKYFSFPPVDDAVECFRYTVYIMGMSLLAAISTERCLSVLFPIWYRCNRPKHLSTAVCAVLWIVVVVLEVLYFVFCPEWDNVYACVEFFTIEFVWFSLFTPMLGVSSLALLLKVQCSSRRRQPPRLYLLVLLNVLVFLLCGLPLGIMDFLLIYYSIDIPDWLPWLLACVNSSVNPFIYFFLGRQRHRRRRESLRKVLQRALGVRRELEAGTRVTSQTITPDTSFCD